MDCYPKALSPWVPWCCLTRSCALPTGKQEQTDPAVPLPRLARSWDPRGWQGDDQHHCSSAETAAAVWQPPHHCALQVKPAWSSWASPEGICSTRDGQNPKHGLDKQGQAGAGLGFSLTPWFLFASAGAGRTGTFCALSTVLERVKAEAILDVFQTVKSLRLQRPHMVQTLVGASCPARTSARTGWGLSVEQKTSLIQGFCSP